MSINKRSTATIALTGVSNAAAAAASDTPVRAVPNRQNNNVNNNVTASLTGVSNVAAAAAALNNTVRDAVANSNVLPITQLNNSQKDLILQFNKCLSNAKSFIKTRQFDKALSMYDNALNICKQLHTDKDKCRAYILNKKGELLGEHLNRLEEAEQILRQALNLALTAFEHNDPKLTPYFFVLGSILTKNDFKNIDEIIDIYNNILLLNKELPEDDDFVVQIKEAIVESLRMRSGDIPGTDIDTAELLLQEIIRIKQQKLKSQKLNDATKTEILIGFICNLIDFVQVLLVQGNSKNRFNNSGYAQSVKLALQYFNLALNINDVLSLDKNEREKRRANILIGYVDVLHLQYKNDNNKEHLRLGLQYLEEAMQIRKKYYNIEEYPLRFAIPYTKKVLINIYLDNIKESIKLMNFILKIAQPYLQRMNRSFHEVVDMLLKKLDTIISECIQQKKYKDANAYSLELINLLKNILNGGEYTNPINDFYALYIIEIIRLASIQQHLSKSFSASIGTLLKHIPELKHMNDSNIKRWYLQNLVTAQFLDQRYLKDIIPYIKMILELEPKELFENDILFIGSYAEFANLLRTQYCSSTHVNDLLHKELTESVKQQILKVIILLQYLDDIHQCNPTLGINEHGNINAELGLLFKHLGMVKSAKKEFKKALKASQNVNTRTRIQTLINSLQKNGTAQNKGGHRKRRTHRK